MYDEFACLQVNKFLQKFQKKNILQHVNINDQIISSSEVQQFMESKSFKVLQMIMKFTVLVFVVKSRKIYINSILKYLYVNYNVIIAVGSKHEL